MATTMSSLLVFLAEEASVPLGVLALLLLALNWDRLIRLIKDWRSGAFFSYREDHVDVLRAFSKGKEGSPK